MAGDHSEEAQFKGLSKHFNSYTFQGRANVSKLTFAAIGVISLYYYLKPKKQAPIEAKS